MARFIGLGSLGCAAAAFTLVALLPDTTWALVAGLVLTGLAAVGGFFRYALARLLFPTFELLPAGGLTRSQRVRGRAKGVAALLLKPAYAAALAVLFTAIVTMLVE